MRPPSERKLARYVDLFPRQRVTVLGDLMLDHFIRGKVSRISPEAPVPVVRVSQETYLPGGAGNVAINIASLKAKVRIISIIGADDAGSRLLSDLQARGSDASGILVDPDRPTTQKIRVVAEHQQVVRFDRESTHPVHASQQDRLLAALEAALADSDALVLSDYGKGVITPRVLQAAIRLARRRGLPVTVDPKVEHFKRYRGVTCITPNLLEASQGMHVPVREDDASVEELGRRILRALRATSVLVTRGEHGMTLVTDHTHEHIPTVAREVFDVTGAGDTVIAVLSLCLAAKARLSDAARVANTAAGIVVGKLGTASVSPDELRRALQGAG